MFTSAMGVHPLGERPQISLDDFPAAPLPNSVTVIAEPAGGLVVRFPDWNGERRTVLILATVYGLGLFMSYGVVREHQGQLLFEGNRRGAVFTVVLPPFSG